MTVNDCQWLSITVNDCQWLLITALVFFCRSVPPEFLRSFFISLLVLSQWQLLQISLEWWDSHGSMERTLVPWPAFAIFFNLPLTGQSSTAGGQWSVNGHLQIQSFLYQNRNSFTTTIILVIFNIHRPLVGDVPTKEFWRQKTALKAGEWPWPPTPITNYRSPLKGNFRQLLGKILKSCPLKPREGGGEYPLPEIFYYWCFSLSLPSAGRAFLF